MTKKQAEGLVEDFEQAVIDVERASLGRRYANRELQLLRERLIAALISGEGQP